MVAVKPLVRFLKLLERESVCLGDVPAGVPRVNAVRMSIASAESHLWWALTVRGLAD